MYNGNINMFNSGKLTNGTDGTLQAHGETEGNLLSLMLIAMKPKWT